VRILLDEQLPRRLAGHITGHQIRTVQQCGWTGLRNGALLMRAVADGFDAFVTADRNLQFQQNLAGTSLRVIELGARSNRLEDLLPLVPDLVAAIGEMRPGERRQVGAD